MNLRLPVPLSCSVLACAAVAANAADAQNASPTTSSSTLSDDGQLAPVTMKSIRARETAQASPPGIVARRSAVATKTDPPLLETPQAVSVITREQLDAHAVQSLDQAVLYTAGISGSLYDKVDAQGRLLYRLTGLARDAGTQTDYTKDRRLTIAPAFTWQPSHNTSFTVLMQYQHDTPDSSGPVRTVIGTAKWQR